MIYSYMVTRNESDRYLAESLLDLVELTDGVLVYDDQSDDDTPEMALDCGAYVWTRPDHCATFVQDESEFREAAWRAMVEVFNPNESDWILTLDADELLYPYGRSGLDMVIKEAKEDGFGGIKMKVREIWDDEQNLERVDGFWGAIDALRLVQYNPGGKFSSKKQGGGSVPLIPGPVIPGPVTETSRLEIHHFGYARQQDREAKYARYSQTKGHNPVHIESILQPPTLRAVA